MASKYTTEKTLDGNEVVIIRGYRYDGLAKVCQTEAEAKAYIRSRKDKDKWAVYQIIERHSRYGKFDVVCRQK